MTTFHHRDLMKHLLDCYRLEDPEPRTRAFGREGSVDHPLPASTARGKTFPSVREPHVPASTDSRKQHRLRANRPVDKGCLIMEAAKRSRSRRLRCTGRMLAERPYPGL